MKEIVSKAKICKSMEEIVDISNSWVCFEFNKTYKNILVRVKFTPPTYKWICVNNPEAGFNTVKLNSIKDAIQNIMTLYPEITLLYTDEYNKFLKWLKE